MPVSFAISAPELPTTLALLPAVVTFRAPEPPKIVLPTPASLTVRAPDPPDQPPHSWQQDAIKNDRAARTAEQRVALTLRRNAVSLEPRAKSALSAEPTRDARSITGRRQSVISVISGQDIAGAAHGHNRVAGGFGQHDCRRIDNRIGIQSAPDGHVRRAVDRHGGRDAVSRMTTQSGEPGDHSRHRIIAAGVNNGVR